jgi:hypothetical protein
MAPDTMGERKEKYSEHPITGCPKSGNMQYSDIFMYGYRMVSHFGFSHSKTGHICPVSEWSTHKAFFYGPQS